MKRQHSPTASAPTVAVHPPEKVVTPHPLRAVEAPTEIWITTPPADPDRGHRWLWFWGGGFLMIALAILLALAGGFLMLWYSNWIFPGVHVFDLDLGNRTATAAEAMLVHYWEEQRVTLDVGSESWTVPPETLGITFDAAATAERARQQGRSLGSLQRLLETGGHLALPPVWVFDASAAEANLRAMAPQVWVAPVDAAVHILEGQVAVTEPRAGQALDVDNTLAQLVQNPAKIFSDGRLPLIMVPVEPAIKDVQAVVDRANQLLSTTVSIQAYDPVTDESISWTLTPDIWGRWLKLEIKDLDTEQLNWTLDSALAKLFLINQVQSLGPERQLDWDSVLGAITAAITDHNTSVRARIYHQPGQHTVQAGETVASIGRAHGIPYPWIQQANPGITDSLSVGQVLTIPSPDALLPFPVVENKRIVVSISQQRLWAYENGGLKWDWPASTGIDTSPTSPGVFQIQTHEPNAYAANWDLWMPYFMGIYRPVPTSGFMNGFHGFPTRDGANLLWTGSLGHQVTYGCILVSTENAAHLYSWAEEGVIVEVQP